MLKTLQKTVEDLCDLLKQLKSKPTPIPQQQSKLKEINKDLSLLASLEISVIDPTKSQKEIVEQVEITTTEAVKFYLKEFMVENEQHYNNLLRKTSDDSALQIALVLHKNTFFKVFEFLRSTYREMDEKDLDYEIFTKYKEMTRQKAIDIFELIISVSMKFFIVIKETEWKRKETSYKDEIAKLKEEIAQLKRKEEEWKRSDKEKNAKIEELKRENERMKTSLVGLNSKVDSKKQSTESESQQPEPEVVEINIPIVYYTTGQQIQFENNGKQIQFNVNGEIADGTRLQIAGCGTPINGQQRDLILVAHMDTANDIYQRNGVDLIQHLIFSSEHAGKTILSDLPMPDGTKQQVTVLLKEGETVTINGQGLLKSDGSRGDLQVMIHLHQQL